MARLKRIQRRLENWAIWSSRGASGGRGFATRSVLASEVWSRGSYNHVAIPVEDEEAAQTDEAVRALKLGKGHLFMTLECIYLKDLGIKETAQRMQRAPSTIKAQLEQADHAISAWLEAQAEERERRRVAAAVSDAKWRAL
ncbi:MAG: hypothetical protein QE495_01395 [Acidovorax sp.]|uniref:hypothetical protein n=1 Tax=Acidovorax sp. TaxID=1872122 RepID=UPI0026312524|nr:hypothetical protein [Acidovorax sp.]MDH4425082.1 hypothetical protein [Acidovorax sp.]